MKEQLAKIRAEALSAFEGVKDAAALDELRVKYLGKKGELTSQLHLRPVQHGEAHADEHFLDLVQRGVHGVAAAHLHGLAGNGHVHRLRLQPQLHSGRLHLFRGALKGALQGGAHLVGQLLNEAKRQIASTIHKLRETIRTLEAKEDPARYKSQITLAKRRAVPASRKPQPR